MIEVKSSLENHHKQCHKRNTATDKLQHTMSQKDKENGDLMRTVTEFKPLSSRRNLILSSLGPVLS